MKKPLKLLITFQAEIITAYYKQTAGSGVTIVCHHNRVAAAVPRTVEARIPAGFPTGSLLPPPGRARSPSLPWAALLVGRAAREVPKYLHIARSHQSPVTRPLTWYDPIRSHEGKARPCVGKAET